MAEEAEGRNVPRSVLLVALLALALGIVIEVSYYAVITGNDDFINSFTMLSTQNTSVLAYISFFFMWMFFIMFIGLIYLRGWGRVLVMVVGLPGIVVYSFKSILLFSYIIGDIMDNVEVDATEVIVLASSLGAIAVAMMTVWYLSRPNVILAFEAREVVLIKRKMGAIERKMHMGKQRCNAGEMSKSELAKLKADCLAKEKVLRGRIRHLDKVRLARVALTRALTEAAGGK